MPIYYSIGMLVVDILCVAILLGIEVGVSAAVVFSVTSWLVQCRVVEIAVSDVQRQIRSKVYTISVPCSDPHVESG